MKYRYVDMITEAIFTLAEQKGSTEEDIWKFISNTKKFKQSIDGGKKQFNIALKRVIEDHKYVEKSKSQVPHFKLSS